MIRMQRMIPLPTPIGPIIILWLASFASGAIGDVVAVSGHIFSTFWE